MRYFGKERNGSAEPRTRYEIVGVVADLGRSPWRSIRLRLEEILTFAEVYRGNEVGNNIEAFFLAAVTLSVLLLSATGIYELMTFTVSQRRWKIEIRSARGALRHAPGNSGHLPAERVSSRLAARRRPGGSPDRPLPTGRERGRLERLRRHPRHGEFHDCGRLARGLRPRPSWPARRTHQFAAGGLAGKGEVDAATAGGPEPRMQQTCHPGFSPETHDGNADTPVPGQNH